MAAALDAAGSTPVGSTSSRVGADGDRTGGDRDVTPPYGDPIVVGEDGPTGHDPAAAPRRRRRRRWPWALVAIVLLGAGYYVVSLYQVWSAGRTDGAHPVQAIVVLGAAQYDGTPSPQLAARLDHAADLWRDGIAPVVMVTGGKQPGDRFTEAEASRAYLLELGVPDGAIELENEGSTTYGSLEHAAALLRVATNDTTGDATDVVLVTDPYHALRSRLIAEEVGLDAEVSPTPTSVVTGAASLRRHVLEAAGVAAGRIVGFDRLTELTG